MWLRVKRLVKIGLCGLEMLMCLVQVVPLLERKGRVGHLDHAVEVPKVFRNVRIDELV